MQKTQIEEEILGTRFVLGGKATFLGMGATLDCLFGDIFTFFLAGVIGANPLLRHIVMIVHSKVRNKKELFPMGIHWRSWGKC